MQQKYRHSDHSQKKKKKYVCNLLDYCKSREPQSLKMAALTDHFRIFWHTLRCLQIWDISLGVFWLILYIGFKKGIFFSTFISYLVEGSWLFCHHVTECNFLCPMHSEAKQYQTVRVRIERKVYCRTMEGGRQLLSLQNSKLPEGYQLTSFKGNVRRTFLVVW